MKSKNRVFSHSSEQNYNDYNKNKVGTEILKLLKKAYDNSKNKNEEFNEINRFNNYNDYLTLTKSYHNYLYKPTCEAEVTKNIYETNNSCVNGKKDDGESDGESETNTNCRDNILYPYGYYNKQQKCDLLFPYKIDISKWCPDKITCPPCISEPSSQFCNPSPKQGPHHIHPHLLPKFRPSRAEVERQPQYIQPQYIQPQYIQPQYIQPQPQPQCNEMPTTCDNSCDKCKTTLCKRGLCATCNKEKHIKNVCYAKQYYKKQEHIQQEKINKKLKTGFPFR